ncbi:UDP-N-acetylglucosamine 1-carboxyvinyltransferase [Candidatus Saccharibacteria bacterium]|nr:UDP-N-acetylglucosamine 1-carboxyvinyltransferase [Candidatus Saccharibacteria bacterium]
MRIEYRNQIGELVTRLREQNGMTQAELAAKINTSQSAINRIENGKQNLTLDLISSLSQALKTPLLTVNDDVITSFVVNGGKTLQGKIKVNSSKNAAVGVLTASLVNHGTTTFKGISRVEETFRIIEVLESIGVKATWKNHNRDLVLVPPKKLNLDTLDVAAARRTRSAVLLLGTLVHTLPKFKLPFAGGCSLGERTVEPHLQALHHYGLAIEARDGFYEATVTPVDSSDKTIIMLERGDTATENALIGAALFNGKTTIKNASPNYMVQDVCFYLQSLGVKITGVGTTTLVVHGKPRINKDVEYYPSEDPIEAMTFFAAALVTKSKLTIQRVPIEFLEIELATLQEMNAKFTISPEYLANNRKTRLADVTFYPSDLKALEDKIAPMPFPGLNIDCLPFFAIIAAAAEGRTMIHDWVYENRAIYLTELDRLGAKVQLLDAHRIFITGPTHFRPANMMTPPALRPAVVLLLAMLATHGRSTLRNVYMINRGYSDIVRRLNSIGADIKTVVGI